MKRRYLPIILLSGLLMAQSTAPPPPKITLNPAAGVQGQTLDITLNVPASTNATITFEPAGNLTASNLRAPQRLLVFTLQISPTATPGPYTFVYTLTGALAAQTAPVRVPNAFTVRTAPPPVTTAAAAPRIVSVRSISPVQFTAGDPPAAAQITGVNFQPGAQVSFSGTGVTAQVTNVATGGNSISATIAAAANAAPGPRNVIVTNPDGSSNQNQQPPVQITVIAARVPQPQAPPTPTQPPPIVSVRSISPTQVTAGDPPVSAQITGANFQAGAQVSFSGTGVTAQVNSVATGGNSISATIDAASSAASGPRNVIVTNPDGSSNQNQQPPEIGRASCRERAES